MAAERQRQGATARKEIGTVDRGEMVRTAIGYVRVSTDMQASEGVSLEAQQGRFGSTASCMGCGCSRFIRMFCRVGSRSGRGSRMRSAGFGAMRTCSLSSSSTGCPAPFVTSADL